MTPAVVRSIYVLLADNEDGEGLCGVQDPALGMMPMVLTDADHPDGSGGTFAFRIEAIRHYAKQLSRKGTRAVRLVKFTVRQDVEVFHPDGRRERTS